MRFEFNLLTAQESQLLLLSGTSETMVFPILICCEAKDSEEWKVMQKMTVEKNPTNQIWSPNKTKAI